MTVAHQEVINTVLECDDAIFNIHANIDTIQKKLTQLVSRKDAVVKCTNKYMSENHLRYTDCGIGMYKNDKKVPMPPEIAKQYHVLKRDFDEMRPKTLLLLDEKREQEDRLPSFLRKRHDALASLGDVYIKEVAGIERTEWDDSI